MSRRRKNGTNVAPLSNESAVGVSTAPPPDPATLANLQFAYKGEMNTDARYSEFAKEADEEGYAPVASLFRAAARAEAIHARNHEKVIIGLGEAPKTNPEPPVVKSTRENIEAALKGETYQRDEMYPSFLHQARSVQNQAAARTFQLAQRAEAEHATLFAQALEQLERLRGDTVTYYICPVCGFTSAAAPASRCLVCSKPTNWFEKVS